MATSSFFYGGSTAPEQNTVDELIDALNQKVSAADQDRVAAEQARDRAETAASNAELSESNVAGLAQQAQETLADANEAVVAANAAVATTNTNAATAATKAAEAASSATAADASADAALVSQNAAAVSASNAATSASTASTQASAAATSATNAASSASSAAGSATTATTQATNASNSATAAAGSASAASTSATNAASSASSASTSATAAASSASSASASATSASGSASTATTKASEAAASATAAATSASNAATSATSASGSASTATTQATNASNSATAAASSASSASTSATNAANSATAAGTSATNAANSATAASGSASAAAASATSAQAAQTAAEAAFDSFDDRYLGAKTVAPTVDNDGNALLTGALYFNSTANQMYAWSGSAWVAAGSTGSGDVVGPASSTDNAIARFDGTTGKLVQNSGASVDDNGRVTANAVTVNSGTATTATNFLSLSHTVNGAANFAALDVNATYTSANQYRFFDFKIGGTTRSYLQSNALGETLFVVRSAGVDLLTGSTGYWYACNTTEGGMVAASTFVGVGGDIGASNPSTRLYADAANTLAQRRGANPQAFRLYNTFTDASNYERGFLRWNTNVLEIGAEAAGTGTARTTRLGVVGTTGAVSVNTTGIALTQPDGASEVYYRNDGFWPATNLNLGLSTARWGTLFTNQANLAGNLSFTGTGNRITGDFSNSTLANRVMFQTSTTNSATSVAVLPNGTSTTGQIEVYANSDPTNASVGQLTALSTDIRLGSNNRGTGTFLPMTFYTGGSERMRLDTSGNLGIGTSSPGQKLVVSGNTAGVVTSIFNSSTTSGSSSSTLQLATNNGGNFANWNVAYVAAGGSYIQLNQTGVGTAYYDIDTQIWRNGAGSERARIDSSGQWRTTVTGGGSVMAEYGCRAWVNFNGTGTVAIRASGNVSSITDNGVGDYTVNFTAAMPDANYAPVVSMNGRGASRHLVMVDTFTNSTGNVRFSVYGTANGGNVGVGSDDDAQINVAIFR